ncbi:hypothetical protein JCM10207_005668 [Rhodosporidiobolus poonsookiae]
MHLEHPPPCPPSCTHCLAYDNLTRALCARTPSRNSKWCSVHEELQAKLLKSYKRLTLAFESFDEATLPRNLEVILAEDDLAKLRTWSEASRSKWSLARRVIVARAEHHQQFYAGGDWGHNLFVETLKAETDKMERFLRALDRRAYAITLANSQASWILDVPTGPSFICDEPSPAAKPAEPTASDAPLTPPPTPPLQSRDLPARGPKGGRKGGRRKPGRQSSNSSSSASTSPPPFSQVAPSIEAENEAFFASLSPTPTASTPVDLLNRLRDYLEPPADLAPTVKGSTWTALIETVFRHVVLRVPSLATLALSSGLVSVGGLLDLLDQRLQLDGEDDERSSTAQQIERLWKALKFARVSASDEADKGKEKEPEEDGLLGVGVLVEALDVVFGAGVNEDEHVVLLGGKVWKNPKEAEWTREGWDLFYQFIACPGCSLIATRSLSTWTTNRRLATLGHLPAWLGPGESTAERVFRLSSIVLCTSNSCQAGRKVKRIEQKEVSKKGKGGKGKKTVFIEEWERSWMYIKLPLNDPRSLLVLDHLSSQSDRFSVLARRTATDGLTHSPQETTSCDSALRRCHCCDGDDLWLNRVRSGFTPIERKAARWTTTSYFPRESVLASLLSSSSPESRFHPHAFEDTYDCVILDASPFTSATHDSWSAFSDAVAQAVLHAAECETVGELLWREKQVAVERGEMAEGEWEAMHSCAAEQGEAVESSGKGRRGSKDGGKKPARKMLFICEDDLTARRIFREEA